MPEALRGSSLGVRVHAVIPSETNGVAPGGQGSSEIPKAGSNGSGSSSGGVAGGGSPGEGQAQNPGSPSSRPGVDWEVENVKYAAPGAPVGFKFVGPNIAIIVLITPYTRDDGKGATIVVQGQVWIKPASRGLVYHTSMDTLSVNYGERVVFYPVGLDATGKAPMFIEISIYKAADLPPPGPDAQGSGSEGKPSEGKSSK
jgi:hypothetical protein